MVVEHTSLKPGIHSTLRLCLRLQVSLFERLVTQRSSASGEALPKVTLAVQHRMRPEVSELVRRTTYPDLIDHLSTLHRPSVKGVAHPVVFVTHEHLEMGDAEAADLGSKSKVNQYEAEMVCLLAKHLLYQEGCTADSVTILTPYLGQLSEIRQTLETLKVGAELNQLDQADLVREGLADQQSAVFNSGARSVRAATVDNFQGEESDIVIISLVRSNQQGDIGFLSNAQRVNVLLSRARNGMYIVGNMGCLSNCRSAKGRDLWRSLEELLSSQGQLLPFLPLVCERHQIFAKVNAPIDFASLTPHGGCTLLCNATLACGHPCPLQCHPDQDRVHKAMVCKHPVMDVCEYGHALQRTCNQAPGSVRCQKYVTWMCAEGHRLAGPCHKGRPMRCNTCEKLQKLEEDAAALEERSQGEVQQMQGKLATLHLRLRTAELRAADRRELARINGERQLVTERLSKLQQDLDTARQRKPRMAETAVPEELPLSDADTVSSEAASVTATFAHLKEKISNRLLKAVAPSERGDGNPQLGNVELPADRRLGTDLSFEGGEGGPASASPLEAGDDNDLQQEAEGDLEVKAASQPAPQAGTQEIKRVLQALESQGALSADNVIDSLLDPSDPQAQLPSNIRRGIEAMRYIIALELDPNGQAKWDLAGDDTSGNLCSLAEAVCCWAAFLQLAPKYPLTARQHAQAVLQFAADDPFGSYLPTAWLEQAAVALEARDVTPPSPLPQYGSSNSESHAAQEKWAEVLQEDREAPAVMANIMAMVGLEEVKAAMVSQYHRIRVAQKQGETAAASYNVRFDGNPGTGKTTIAKHYGLFLQQLGVLPEDSRFVETSGAALIQKGVSYLEQELDQVKEAGGGLVFVDEAYQLTSDREGKKVLDFLLPLAEGLHGKYGPLVWLFAGYSKDMDKLFEHNEGMPSRFPLHFTFRDYNDKQLEKIFKGLMETRPSTTKSEASVEKTDRNEHRSTSLPRKSTGFSHRQAPEAGSTEQDNFGNTWTWRGASWYDQYGNTTGYGPASAGFATAENPLVSPDGKFWTHDGNKTWRSDHGDSQEHYPGSPEPTHETSAEARPNPFHLQSDKSLRIAMRRLGRGRGRPGFGNARAVRTLFDRVRDRQADRLANEARERGEMPDLFLLTDEDMLGPPPSGDRIRRTTAYQKLQSLEGLAPVKEQVEALISLVESNWGREQREEPVLDVVLNRIFLGNPGTGKTTVARLYGAILGKMGLLSKGDVVLKNSSDFLGDVLGSSEKTTRDILRAAEGSVLVIDEAYSLYSGGSDGAGANNDPYRTAVVDTLVEQVQAKPGDDRAVVLLGYEDEMRLMLKHCNPGLSRRFQLENAFNFPDFSDEALVRVLLSKAHDASLELSLAVAKRAVASLARARARPHFGNAGAVENLLSEAKLRLQADHSPDGNRSVLMLEDFGLTADRRDDAALDNLFNDLLGCAEVREKMEELRATAVFAQGRGADAANLVSYNYVFTGNPGTGKTTVWSCTSASSLLPIPIVCHSSVPALPSKSPSSLG